MSDFFTKIANGAVGLEESMLGPDYQYYDLFKSLEMKTDSWKKISHQIHENNQLQL